MIAAPIASDERARDVLLDLVTTLSRVWYETRSPLKSFSIVFTYCVVTGLSKPQSLRIAAIWALFALRPGHVHGRVAARDHDEDRERQDRDQEQHQHHPEQAADDEARPI